MLFSLQWQIKPQGKLHIVDDKADQPLREDADTAPQSGKRPYKRPVLIKLGSLHDITMTLHGGGAADGRPNRGTKRGGDSAICTEKRAE